MVTERFIKPVYFFAVALLCAASVSQQAEAQRRISAGQTVSSRLDSLDGKVGDGAKRSQFYKGGYSEFWRFDGRAGDQITVIQSSSDFDCLLAVGRWVDGKFQSVLVDDDGAGGSNSRVVYLMSSDGEYGILAQSWGPVSVGGYTLRVDKATGGSVPARTLVAGQSFSGHLDASDLRLPDNRHYDLWRFSGQAGEKVSIVMSAGIGAAMEYGRMNGSEFTPLGRSALTPGGSGWGLGDAKIELTLPHSGEYIIRATSIGVDTGEYRMSVVAWAGSIGLNQRVTGTLTASDNRSDGSRYDVWRISGQAGQKARITLRSSDFPPQMSLGYVQSGMVVHLVISDLVDGPNGTDAVLEVRFPNSADYVITVHSSSKLLGGYTLSVEPL